jgi:CRISPR system Cascade subunit CasE
MYLHRLTMNSARVRDYATRRHLARHDADDGYVMHAALVAVFGESAPKPFALEHELDAVRLEARDPVVLLHSALTREQLEERADEEQGRMIDWRRSSTRVLPALPAGREVAFHARVAPVVRSRCGAAPAPGKARAKSTEMDAYLAAKQRSETGEVNRVEVYREWLARCLGDTATVVAFELRDSRVERVVRRGYRGAEHREVHALSLPLAVMRGVVRVEDEDGFRALVERGLGRHRAFGYGLMLVGDVALQARG